MAAFMSIPRNAKLLLKFSGPILYGICLLMFVDLGAVATIIGHMRLDMALFSIAAFPVLAALQSYRWWIVCGLLKMRISLTALSQIFYVSWFLRIIPFVGTIGLARIVYLKNAGQQTSRAAVAVFFDKALEMMGLFLFGAIGVIYLPKEFVQARPLAVIWGGGILVALVLPLAAPILGPRVKKIVNRYLAKRLKDLGGRLKQLLADLWAGFTMGIVVLQLVLTLCINLMRAVVIFLLALSLGLDVDFMPILACNALIGLVNVLPITVNGLGTRDAVLLLMLPIWGISSTSALSLGLISFLWVVVTQAFSVVFYLKLPLPWKALAEMKRILLTEAERPSKGPEQGGAYDQRGPAPGCAQEDHFKHEG